MITKNPITVSNQTDNINIEFSDRAPKNKQKLWVKDQLPSDIHIAFTGENIMPDFNYIGGFTMTLKKFTATRYNNNLYIFGGHDGNEAQKTIINYNINTNIFNRLETELPYILCGSGSAIIGQNIYIVGGYTAKNTFGKIYNTVLVYNTSTNTITPTNIFLPKFLANVSCVAKGTKIYVMGGVYSSQQTYTTLSPNPNIYIIDTTNNRVEVIIDAISEEIYPGLIAKDSKIYIFGNKNDGTSIISYLDTTNSQITNIATLKSDYNGGHSLTQKGDFVYMWYDGVIQKYDFNRNRVSIIKKHNSSHDSYGAVTFYNNNNIIMALGDKSNSVIMFNTYNALPIGEYCIKISPNGDKVNLFSINGFYTSLYIDKVYKTSLNGTLEEVDLYYFNPNGNYWAKL